MLTLALLVLGGAVITTLVQAEDKIASLPAPPGYLQPGVYRLNTAAAAPSQHRWLLPTAVRASLEQGRYNIYFQDAAAPGSVQSSDEADTRMSFSIGDLGAEQAAFSVAHDQALTSDWEREQTRLNNAALFSMSVGHRW